jgi:antitoxin ParD1/3/4
MKSLNVSMPEAMRRFIESQVGDRTSYSTPSEYIRDLIRQDQRRKSIDQLLVEGLESGEPVRVGRQWKQAVRREASKRRTGGYRNGAARSG